jgi:hypothetical protein
MQLHIVPENSNPQNGEPLGSSFSKSNSKEWQSAKKLILPSILTLMAT